MLAPQGKQSKIRKQHLASGNPAVTKPQGCVSVGYGRDYGSTIALSLHFYQVVSTLASLSLAMELVCRGPSGTRVVFHHPRGGQRVHKPMQTTPALYTHTFQSARADGRRSLKGSLSKIRRKAGRRASLGLHL